MHFINLKSSDGKIYACDLRAAKRSNVIKTMLMVLEVEKDMQDLVIPIYSVDGETLKKVIDFCHKHIDDPEQADEGEMLNFSQRDIEEFQALDPKTLFAIVNASNYLDIPDLKAASCKAVANQISGKSADEIRGFFKIKNDFTPEEEAQVRREYEMRQAEAERLQEGGRIFIHLRRD